MKRALKCARRGQGKEGGWLKRRTKRKDVDVTQSSLVGSETTTTTTLLDVSAVVVGHPTLGACRPKKWASILKQRANSIEEAKKNAKMCGKSYESVQGREKRERERGEEREGESETDAWRKGNIRGRSLEVCPNFTWALCKCVCVSITISVRVCVCMCVCIVAWNYEIISWLVTRLKYPVEARPRCQPQAKELCRRKKSKSRGREG